MTTERNTDPEKNPWYQLATQSGTTHKERRRIWNGYQKYLLEDLCLIGTSDPENLFSCVESLGEHEIENIRSSYALTQGQDHLEYISFKNNVFKGNTDFSGLFLAISVGFEDALFKCQRQSKSEPLGDHRRLQIHNDRSYTVLASDLVQESVKPLLQNTFTASLRPMHPPG